MRITDDHYHFMHCVSAGGSLPLADRKQDKIRQQLRKSGLVEYTGKPKRWQLTYTGQHVLREWIKS